MILKSLLGNSQSLDGGAMFGNAPRELWSQWLMPNEKNCIPLACRCLLLNHNNKNILLEAGIGNFFEPKLKQRFGVVESNHVLLASLQEENLTHDNIDYVILSHLHFDHAGGLLSSWQEDQELELLFPNAKYLVSEEAWERATHPHPRDRASFIPVLNTLLKESGRVILIKNGHPVLGEDFRFHFSHGHTPGMMLTEISTSRGPLLFSADLIPGVPWVRVPITMGYDRFPELLINEKQGILEYLAEVGGYLFFTHDPKIAVGQVAKTQKGGFELHQQFENTNFFNECFA